MLKKILHSIVCFSVVINAKVIANYQSDMLPKSNDWKWVTQNLLDWANWETQVDNLSSWLIESIEWILPLIAVWVFLFVGIKLAMARWNPEEFKKAWMQFLYAIIGIFAVSFAWITVKLVSSLSI